MNLNDEGHRATDAEKRRYSYSWMWPVIEPDAVAPALVLGRRATSPDCVVVRGPLRASANRSAQTHYTCHTKPASAARVALPQLEAHINSEQGGRRPRGTLLVWRSRYWWNFGELAMRVVRMADSLSALAQPLIILVPPVRSGWTPPAFYRALLAPFGSVHVEAEAAIAANTDAPAWVSARLCCINSLIMDSVGRQVFRDRMHAHHLAQPTLESRHAVPRAALSGALSAGSTRASVLRLIRRTGPRQLNTHVQLLADCHDRRITRAFASMEVRFGAAPPECLQIEFGNGALPLHRALEETQQADVLVGVHGVRIRLSNRMGARSSRCRPLRVVTHCL